jgi:hypothetical protein
MKSVGWASLPVLTVFGKFLAPLDKEGAILSLLTIPFFFGVSDSLVYGFFI